MLHVAKFHSLHIAGREQFHTEAIRYEFEETYCDLFTGSTSKP